MIGGFLSYWWLVFQVIGEAWWLTPDKFQRIYDYRTIAAQLMLGVVFVAGVSQLIGQSVILFANKVKPTRFFLSLLTNGIVFVVSFFVTVLIIYLVGSLLFFRSVSLELTVAAVGASYGPLAFSFLALAPYAGMAIDKFLRIMSFLNMLLAVHFIFAAPIWQALIVVAVAFLVMLLMTNTIGKPVIWLRNKVFHLVTGADVSTDDSLRELMEAYYRDDSQAQRPAQTGG